MSDLYDYSDDYEDDQDDYIGKVSLIQFNLTN